MEDLNNANPRKGQKKNKKSKKDKSKNLMIKGELRYSISEDQKKVNIEDFTFEASFPTV